MLTQPELTIDRKRGAFIEDLKQAIRELETIQAAHAAPRMFDGRIGELKFELFILADQASLSDEKAEQIGKEISSVFYLKKDDDEKDRWKSTEGNKTNIGLARTIFRMIKEAF